MKVEEKSLAVMTFKTGSVSIQSQPFVTVTAKNQSHDVVSVGEVISLGSRQ